MLRHLLKIILQPNLQPQTSRIIKNDTNLEKPNNIMVISRFISTSQNLHKKSKNSSQNESDSDEEPSDFFEDKIVDKNTKILDLKVTNLRLDGILKAGLGLARNKIEVSFYENKIRVNGEKVLKKSESVDVGDEIDVIKGPSPTNPKLLTVARVEVLNITPKEEFIALKLRRCKNLLIENYNDVWKSS